jgi:hypothetical protein
MPDGGNARVLTDNSVEEKTLDISPDGTQVLFTADMNERFEINYPTNLFVVPPPAAHRGLPAPGSPFQFDQGRSGRRTARRSSPASTWACTRSSSGSTSPPAGRTS